MISSNAVSAKIEDAIHQIAEATAAKKCWACGCFHSSLKAIEETFRNNNSEALQDAIEAAKRTFQDVKYDCLGCEICYPALAVNALEIEDDACPTEEVEKRDGWPPLPGGYTVCRYQSPVAVCTLTDDDLRRHIVSDPEMDVAIAGTMQTENLGVERVILNVLANPNIRFLIVCGPDSRKTIGHLPGQALVALAHNGLDDDGRIIGAQGKRPLLRNIPREAVAYFRRTVTVVDLIGCADMVLIRKSIQTCIARNPGAAEPFEPETAIKPMQGYLPRKMVTDPAGYFVIYVDRQRRCLSLEHYRKNGTLNAVIEGRSAAELYIPAIDKELVSRLDHAAYLGKELARAEQALLSGMPYEQDAAPEQGLLREVFPSCGCTSSCGGNSL